MTIIAFEGNIAIGKTTLVKKLAQKMTTKKRKYEYVSEPIDDEMRELLKKSLKEKESPDHRYEFQKQLFLRHKKIIEENENTDKIVFLDRSVLSDFVFSYYFLCDNQFKIVEFLKDREELCSKIFMCIYLKQDPQIAYQNYQNRGDIFEDGYNLNYFQQLEKFHELILPQYTKKFNVKFLEFNVNSQFASQKTEEIINIIKKNME